jgi:hypothetical protein
MGELRQGIRTGSDRTGNMRGADEQLAEKRLQQSRFVDHVARLWLVKR